jgi:hypothetical protein
MKEIELSLAAKIKEAGGILMSIKVRCSGKKNEMPFMH